MPTYRRVGKRILDYATALTVENGMLTDSQCGYRAFSWKAVEAIEPTESGLGIESQMLTEAQERGLRVESVSVNARYDVGRSKYSPWKHGTGVLASLVSLVSERRPLFFFGVTGFVLVMVAAVLGVMVVRTFYATGDLAIGSSIVVVMLMILGTLAIFIGLVLNMLKRMLARS